MTKPSTIRLLGAIAIAGWIACAGWALLEIQDPSQIDTTTLANVLTDLIIGFAASMPFLVAVGFAILERD